MFCQTCGTQLRPTAHFCNHCGKPVEERFGTALLHARKPGTAEVKPGQTAEQLLDSAPTTPELSPKPPTDQIAQRGTDRQPLAKTTGPEENAAVERATDFIGTPPGAITNVSSQLPGHFSANAQPVPEPSPQQSFGAVSHAVTQVEDETLAAAPSTEEMQVDAAAKPFFTQLPAPALQQPNPQHRRLVRAAPLVLLALIVLLILAYLAAK